MFRTSRLRMVVGVAVTGVLVVVGLAGCGHLKDRVDGDAATTEMSWSAQALQSVGFADADLVGVSEPLAQTADSTAGPARRHPRLRYAFQHALHGEATVATDEGTKIVVAQRGEVTAVTATSITVKSSDGFTLTWVVADRTVVVVNRAKSQLTAVTTGATVGVAGTRDAGTVTARLVVVPKKA